MTKKLWFVLFVFLISGNFLLGQQNAQLSKKSKITIDKVDETNFIPHNPEPSLKNTGNAVLAGKSWNAFFVIGSNRNQIFTDPYSGLIGIIKRTDRTGAGSGRIVYQLSSDGGANWSPQSNPINTTNTGILWRNNGRFPGMVMINPNKNPIVGNQLVVGTYACLDASGANWDRLCMAKDNSLLGGTDYSWWTDSVNNTIPDKPFINSSNHIFIPCEVNFPDITPNAVNWNIYKSTNAGAFWTKFPIATNDQIHADSMNYFTGFINKAGVGYIIIQGKYPSVPYYTFGYRKTTDSGTTWTSNYIPVAWQSMPELQGKVHAMTYSVDCTVDKTGRLHFVAYMEDTNTGVNSGIYHFYLDGATWKAARVSKLVGPFSVTVSTSTTQTEIHCATDWDRDLVVISWRDWDNETNQKSDIYFSKWVPGQSFYPKISTATSAINEKYSKLAPILFWNSSRNKARADLFYTILGNGDTEDALEAEIYYLKDIYFTDVVQLPTLMLTSPNGGENWRIGTNRNITWNQEGVTNVKIEYTTNNGTNWVQVTASTPAAAASYSWTIPNTPSSLCKVKLTDVSNAAIIDMSDNVFSIDVPPITITSPNGGENWIVGSSKIITWNQSGVTNLKIEYTTNNGTSWTQVTASTSAVAGSYSWTVPNTPSSQCKVRLTDVSNEASTDISDNLFNIIYPSPNEWYYGSKIKFNGIDTLWSNPYLCTVGENGRLWVISSKILGTNFHNAIYYSDPGDTYMKRFIDFDLNGDSDSLTGNIGMLRGISTLKNDILVTASVPYARSKPNTVGSQYYYPNSDTLLVEKFGFYHTGSGYGTYLYGSALTPDSFSISGVYQATMRFYNFTKSIISPGRGSYIPPAPYPYPEIGGYDGLLVSIIRDIAIIPNGDYKSTEVPYYTSRNARIPNFLGGIGVWKGGNTASPKDYQCQRVSDTYSLLAFGVNNEFPYGICIDKNKVLWVAGTDSTRRWVKGFEVIGASAKPIFELPAIWSKTNPNPNGAPILKPSDVALAPNATTAYVTDISNNCVYVFRKGIATVMTLTSPNGAEYWPVGSSRNITWTQTGVTNVKIEYTTNNGTSWTPITSSTPATAGSYSWTVPNTPSTQCKIKVTDVSNATNTDMSDNVFTISNQLCKDVALLLGWNMLSVPVTANDMTATVLFPTVASNFFLYSNGYQTATTLETGKGYWAKFNVAGNQSVCGNAIASVNVPVLSGWNMIGGYDINITVSGITSTPSGIISSNFFEYNNGYTVPTQLMPGKGYWVKVSQNGSLNLPVGLLAKSTDEVVTDKTEFKEQIIISDRSGMTNTLYLTKEQTDLSGYELPPAPPQGIADVRYSSDRYVENSATEQIIKLNSLDYPVKIKASGTDLIIEDNIDGKQFRKVLKDGKEAMITNPQINSIKIKSAELPREYSLSQNYPNPFNPSTKIKFALPEKGIVKLYIYNTLGQKVAELIDEEREAGYYETEWNAAGLSTGIYLYEIRIGEFRAIKKMMLMK